VRFDTTNLIYNNLVGLRARILSASDPTQVGIEGRVVDETSRTLTISTINGEKMIQKNHTRFSFYLPQELVVDGDAIAKSPEERLRMLRRRR